MPATARIPSTQQGQTPEQVTPRADDSTAELGAEGGSYGDLTQSVRSRREWASEQPTGWRLAPAALVVLIIAIAVLAAVMFWATAG